MWFIYVKWPQTKTAIVRASFTTLKRATRAQVRRFLIQTKTNARRNEQIVNNVDIQKYIKLFVENKRVNIIIIKYNW